MLRRGSLARRLVVVSVAWIAVSVLAGGIALSLAFRGALGAAADARLEAWLHALVASVRTGPSGEVTLARSLGDPRFDQVFSGLYWQIESDGGVVAASRSLWDERLTLPEGPTDAQGHRRGLVIGPRAQALRFASEGLTLPDQPAPLRIVIAADDAETRRAVAHLDALLIGALGLLAAGLAAAVALQVAVGLRPLTRLARALESVRGGERDRLPEDGPEELAPLVASLNALLDEEAERVRRARAQAGNLAHALRTPLSLLALDADAIAGDEGERLRRRVDALRSEIDQRLARAAIAGPGAVRSERTPVAPVARDVAGTLRRLYADRTVEVDVPEGLVFRGDHDDLLEIAGNLAENACKWARRQVEIRASAAPGERLVLVVDDDGPGMDEEDAARATARGVRLDERSPGAGLGLAIVSDIARAHGGSLRLSASALGGLRAEVTLPGAPPGNDSRMAV